MINIWPFNKRNKTSTNNNSAFMAKSKRRSILAIVGASFISLLTFGGAGASIAMAANEYSLNAEYSDSYNIRIELDTSMQNEDPYADAPASNELPEMVENSANAYSEYLFNRGISDFSVYPEYIPAHGSYDAQAFINAVIPNQKGLNRTISETQDLPQENIMMNFTQSSRISLMMDLWTSTDPSSATRYISVIPQEKLISGSNKISIDPNNSSKVDIDTTNFIEGLSGGDKTWKDLSDTWFTETKASQLFFIRDLSGLVNRMNFILQVYRYVNNPSGSHPIQYSSPYNFISANEAEWAKNVFDKNTTDPQDLFFTVSGANVQFCNYDDYGSNWTNPGTQKQVNWSMVSRLIDQYGPGDASTTSVTPSKMPTWMKPYVLGIATNASESSISNSITNYIPEKNPKNTSQDANGNWLTLPLSSRFEAQSVIDAYNNYSFALPIKSFSGNNNISPENKDNHRVIYKPDNGSNAKSLQYDGGTTDKLYGVVPYLLDSATHEMPPSLVGNVFGSPAILGSIIALSVIILLIGILVSILYRIPGVFGFGTILCSLSLTLFIMLATGYALSLGLLSGLFIGLIIGVISMFAIMERIKKQQQTGVGFDNSFKIGTRKGLLPAIDLHAILLLCGVCFIYFNRLELEIFGISIVFVALFSFIFNVFLWNSINWIFFSNKINMTRHDFAFSFLKINPTKTQHFAVSNFDTSFQIKRDLKWFNIFGKKEIILSSLLVVVAITGLIVLFTAGVRTSYVFYGGTRLVVPEDYNGAWLPPSNWSEKFLYHHFWYYSYNYIIPWNPNASSAYGDILFQTISSAAITNYVKMAVNSALIASGLICAYTLLRLNWISVIPTFIGLTATPLLAVALLSVFQVYFDINIVLALNILYVINAFFVINMISNISSTSIRTQSFNINELLKVLNYELKNQIHYFLLIIISIFGMIFVLMLFSSSTLFWFYLPILIGTIVSILITFTIIPTLLSFFIRIRYKYWANNVLDNSGSQRWKSYDIVDEQLIEGINKSKKKVV